MESHTDEPGLWIWFSGICCERGGPSELFHRCGARRWLKHANASERRWRLTKSYPCASGEDGDKIRWDGFPPNDQKVGSSFFAVNLFLQTFVENPVSKRPVRVRADPSPATRFARPAQLFRYFTAANSKG